MQGVPPERRPARPLWPTFGVDTERMTEALLDFAGYPMGYIRRGDANTINHWREVARKIIETPWDFLTLLAQQGISRTHNITVDQNHAMRAQDVNAHVQINWMMTDQEIARADRMPSMQELTASLYAHTPRYDDLSILPRVPVARESDAYWDYRRPLGEHADPATLP